MKMQYRCSSGSEKEDPVKDQQRKRRAENIRGAKGNEMELNSFIAGI